MAAVNGNYSADLFDLFETTTTGHVQATTKAAEEIVGLRVISESSGYTNRNQRTSPGELTDNIPPEGTVTAILPTSMTFNDTSEAIAVTGTFFTTGMTADLGPEITIDSVVFNSATSLTVNISADGTLPTGHRPFTIIDVYGRRWTLLNQTFEVTGPPAPVLTSISPNSMALGAMNVIVTVTGSNFVPGMTCDLGPDLATAVTYISPVLCTVEVDTINPVGFSTPFTLTEPVLGQTGILPDDVFTVNAGTTAPSISNRFPSATTPLGRNTPVGFTVTDVDVDLFREFVTASFPGQAAEEVVYDGFNFASLYSTSSRTSVTEGFQFTLRRANGWPGPPTIRVFAIDRTGNEL